MAKAFFVIDISGDDLPAHTRQCNRMDCIMAYRDLVNHSPIRWKRALTNVTCRAFVGHLARPVVGLDLIHLARDLGSPFCIEPREVLFSDDMTFVESGHHQAIARCVGSALRRFPSTRLYASGPRMAKARITRLTCPLPAVVAPSSSRLSQAFNRDSQDIKILISR